LRRDTEIAVPRGDGGDRPLVLCNAPCGVPAPARSLWSTVERSGRTSDRFSAFSTTPVAGLDRRRHFAISGRSCEKVRPGGWRSATPTARAAAD